MVTPKFKLSPSSRLSFGKKGSLFFLIFFFLSNFFQSLKILLSIQDFLSQKKILLPSSLLPPFIIYSSIFHSKFSTNSSSFHLPFSTLILFSSSSLLHLLFFNLPSLSPLLYLPFSISSFPSSLLYSNFSTNSSFCYLQNNPSSVRYLHPSP